MRHEGSLSTEAAKGLVHGRRRIEFCYTLKHGNWVNIAENKLSAMMRQCLSGRRIRGLETFQAEIAAWSKDVNTRQHGSTGT